MENTNIGDCVYCRKPLSPKRDIIGGIECTPRYVCRDCLDKLASSRTQGEATLGRSNMLYPKTKENK